MYFFMKNTKTSANEIKLGSTIYRVVCIENSSYIYKYRHVLNILE